MALSGNEIAILIKARDEASGTMDRVQGKAKGLSKMLGTALKAGALAGGAALVGVGVASLKMGMDFEKTMAEVKTLMPDISEKAFGKMKDDVLAFSAEMGIATDKAVPALYQAISAGVPKENVMEFMTVASKAAIGGVTELEVAVDGITSVVNAYGAANISAQKAADVMFTGVRLGKTTFEELSASLYNVVPMASAAGISFEEVTAALASLTAQGVPTAQATTQLRAAIQALAAPTEAQSKLMEELGLDFSASRLESIGLVGAFDELNTATGGNMETMRKLVGSTEALMAILGLSGEQAAAFKDAIAEAEEATGGLDEAFETVSETTSYKLNKAINEIKVEMTKVAVEVLPKLLDAFENLKDIFKDVSVAVAPFVETFVTGLGEVLDAFKTLADYIYENKPLLIAAIAAIGVAIVLAFGPLSAAVAAVTGLIYLFGKLREVIGTAEDEVAGSLSGMTQAANETAISVDHLRNEVQGTGRPLTDMAGNITRLTQAAKESNPQYIILRDEVERIKQRIIDANAVLPPLAEGLKDTGEGAGDAAGGVGGLTEELEDAEEALADLEDAINPINEMFSIMAGNLDSVTSSIHQMLGIQTQEEAELEALIALKDLEIEKLDRLAEETITLSKAQEDNLYWWGRSLLMKQDSVTAIEDEIKALERKEDIEGELSKKEEERLRTLKEERDALEDSIEELEAKIEGLKNLAGSSTDAGKAAAGLIEELEAERDALKDDLDLIEATKDATGAWADAQVEGRPSLDNLTGSILAQGAQLGLWGETIDSLPPHLRDWYRAHASTVFDISRNFNHLLLAQSLFVDDSKRLAQEWAAAWAEAGNAAFDITGASGGSVVPASSGRGGGADRPWAEGVSGGTVVIQPVVQAQILTGDQRQLEELTDALMPLIRQRHG